jgi:hypothetical protein
VKQYEYKSILNNPAALDPGFLNRLGAEGWKLVAALTLTGRAGNTIYYFRRPKPEEPVMYGHENIWGEAAQGRANAHD